MDRVGFTANRLLVVYWGRSVFLTHSYLPYLGYVTLLMNDFPMLKYVVLGLMGLSMLLERE